MSLQKDARKQQLLFYVFLLKSIKLRTLMMCSSLKQINKLLGQENRQISRFMLFLPLYLYHLLF